MFPRQIGNLNAVDPRLAVIPRFNGFAAFSAGLTAADSESLFADCSGQGGRPGVSPPGPLVGDNSCQSLVGSRSGQLPTAVGNSTASGATSSRSSHGKATP